MTISSMEQKVQNQLCSEALIGLGAGVIVAFPACMILVAAYCMAGLDKSDDKD